MKNSVVKTTKFMFDDLCIKENMASSFIFIFKIMPENAVSGAIGREVFQIKKLL